ncbi:hypothetical protein BBK14_24160 [Parafrankia soli]|uniref:Uncharacterized protein n=1 Tax=Parafrankia soli TaxID=2599596 RepID=A0A1S1PR71_9ACTN|nr:hypothetical protein BBK14_24160 [Parafrankia soli]
MFGVAGRPAIGRPATAVAGMEQVAGMERPAWNRMDWPSVVTVRSSFLAKSGQAPSPAIAAPPPPYERPASVVRVTGRRGRS